jgi:DNA-binding FadR family transcriptional regulator
MAKDPPTPEPDQSSIGGASLLLTAIRGGNAYEETVEKLLQTIRLGLVQPGDRLPSERELAVMLDVSRDTVRDATSSLAEAGFLDIRRGRYGGTFVSAHISSLPSAGVLRVEVSPEGLASEIRDLLVFREVLETGAARAAASSNLTSDIRDALWRAHLETSSASPDDYRRQDSRLHLFIAEITGSRRLVGEVASTRMRVNELLEQIPLLTPNIGHSNHQHEEIVQAILRGQPDLAEMAMRDHLEGTAALLRGFLG